MKTGKYILTALLSVLLCLSFLFSSCAKDENPVKPVDPPPVHPDTADRYIWSVVKSGPYDMNSIYVADSNNIYIGCGWRLYFSDGKNFTYYNLNDNNFHVDNFYGYDKNNIFVIGHYYYNGKNYGELKKITNGVISNYLFENKHGLFYDLLVTGPNQVWISELYTSKVLFFNNGLVNEYVTNKTDSLYLNFFYISPEDNIYVFGAKTNNYYTGYLYSYKLENNEFRLIQSDNAISYPILFRCGKDIMKYNGAYTYSYFSGENWILYQNLDSTAMPSRLGGISKDSLVLIDGNGIIYSSNGKKWNKEKQAPFLYFSQNDYFHNIETKYGNVYSTFWGQNDSYFFVGRPNKNYKK